MTLNDFWPTTRRNPEKLWSKRKLSGETRVKSCQIIQPTPKAADIGGALCVLTQRQEVWFVNTPMFVEIFINYKYSSYCHILLNVPNIIWSIGREMEHGAVMAAHLVDFSTISFIKLSTISSFTMTRFSVSLKILLLDS